MPHTNDHTRELDLLAALATATAAVNAVAERTETVVTQQTQYLASVITELKTDNMQRDVRQRLIEDAIFGRTDPDGTPHPGLFDTVSEHKKILHGDGDKPGLVAVIEGEYKTTPGGQRVLVDSGLRRRVTDLEDGSGVRRDAMRTIEKRFAAGDARFDSIDKRLLGMVQVMWASFAAWIIGGALTALYWWKS